MVKPRLIKELGDSRKYIFFIVAAQTITLVSQIGVVFSLVSAISLATASAIDWQSIALKIAIIIACLAVRMICEKQISKFSYLASCDVKRKLRSRIFEKMLQLGSSYSGTVSTSKVLQVSIEGIEQLEVYFGKYLPQLSFSLIAPLILFATLFPISWKASLVLLICVPLIPVSIVAVQKIAGRLFSKYWGIYTDLGDSFLENLQGMTTLKVYASDEMAEMKMDEEASLFRKVTMKVLTMQLNSTSVMDIIAYGGASVGIAVSATQFLNGEIDLFGALCIMLLSAEFFLPLRLLGSFFHIAMNGMAASDKMFEILDLPEPKAGKLKLDSKNIDIEIEHLSYSYDNEREILHDTDLKIEAGSFVSIVGESGCGKSTIAKLLAGINRGYEGNIHLAGKRLLEISEQSLHNEIVRVAHNSHIFKGTISDNLKMAKPNAEKEELKAAISKVNLDDFLTSKEGLETKLDEGGSNLSGGQKQRLVIARALLKDASIYIFDEATSNIDVESEEIIMETIRSLAKTKTVILISHRLANVVKSDCIYFIKSGRITEVGSHEELLDKNGEYASLFKAQKELESYCKAHD